MATVNTPEMLGIICELLAILGFAGAAIAAIVLVSLRIARGAWRSATAVRVGDQIRWIAEDGTLHAELAEVVEEDDPVDYRVDAAAEHDDHFEIHYRARVPERHYLERVAPDERFTLVIAGVLVAVAVVASVVSFVLLFF